MEAWIEVSEGLYKFEDEDWAMYLSIDESGAMLKVYNGTTHITTKNWGPGIVGRSSGSEWCMKQSCIILDAEKKKRG
jgi:hypothetical protein